MVPDLIQCNATPPEILKETKWHKSSSSSPQAPAPADERSCSYPTPASLSTWWSDICFRARQVPRPWLRPAGELCRYFFCNWNLPPWLYQFQFQFRWKFLSSRFRVCSPWLIYCSWWSDPSVDRQTGAGRPCFWRHRSRDLTPTAGETGSTTNRKQPVWEMQSGWPGQMEVLTGRAWVRELEGGSLDEQNLLWKSVWTVVFTFYITFEIWFYKQVFQEQTDQENEFKKTRNLKNYCFRFLLACFWGALKWDRVSLWVFSKALRSFDGFVARLN